jgi:hypothetical protein
MKYAIGFVVLLLLFLITTMTLYYMQFGYMPSSFDDYWNFVF